MLLMMQRKERKGTTQEKKVMKQSWPADSLKSWKGSNGHLGEGTGETVLSTSLDASI